MAGIPALSPQNSPSPSFNHQGRPRANAKLRWACPFCKYDPVGEKHCGSQAGGFESPTRVKTHLKERHNPTIRCQTCDKRFKTVEETENHKENENCIFRPSKEKYFLSPEALEGLERHDSKTGTDEDRWYYFFSTIFKPDAPPRSFKNRYSPYHENDAHLPRGSGSQGSRAGSMGPPPTRSMQPYNPESVPGSPMPSGYSPCDYAPQVLPAMGASSSSASQDASSDCSTSGLISPQSLVQQGVSHHGTPIPPAFSPTDNGSIGSSCSPKTTRGVPATARHYHGHTKSHKRPIGVPAFRNSTGAQLSSLVAGRDTTTGGRHQRSSSHAYMLERRIANLNSQLQAAHTRLQNMNQETQKVTQENISLREQIRQCSGGLLQLSSKFSGQGNAVYQVAPQVKDDVRSLLDIFDEPTSPVTDQDMDYEDESVGSEISRYIT